MRNLNVIQFRDKTDFLLRNAGKGQLITECRTAGVITAKFFYNATAYRENYSTTFCSKTRNDRYYHHIINSVLLNSLRLEEAVFHFELYYTLFTHSFFNCCLLAL